MSEQDRRTLIADAAIEIVSEQGVRALTHLAVDDRLGLARGSTSFYARTRRALLEMAVRRLAARARADFDAAEAGRAAPADPRSAARRIAGQLDRMLGERRGDVVARYALVAEVAGDPELHGLLARAAFSRELAVELLAALGARDADGAGAGLVGLCEGLVFDHVIGGGSLDAARGSCRARLQVVVEAYLRGALGA